jgi:hypothetical protein
LIEKKRKMGSALKPLKSWLRFFQFEEGRDTPSDIQNVLLVIPTLIAAMTYQVGLNPTGGIWQDDKDEHNAGRTIDASRGGPYLVFLISNTGVGLGSRLEESPRKEGKKKYRKNLNCCGDGSHKPKKKEGCFAVERTSFCHGTE